MFPFTRVTFVLVAYFLSEAVSKTTTTSTTTRTPAPNTTTTRTTPSTSTTTTTPSPQYSKTVECKSSASSQNEQDEGNYGDMVCYDEANYGTNHQLLIRDTVINYDQESQANYHKDLANIAVTRVNVLNFGRSHGFTKSIIIENHEYGARVDINIEIPSSKEVRLFVEVYGQNRDKLTNPQRMSKNLI